MQLLIFFLSYSQQIGDVVSNVTHENVIVVFGIVVGAHIVVAGRN